MLKSIFITWAEFLIIWFRLIEENANEKNAMLSICMEVIFRWINDYANIRHCKVVSESDSL